MKYGKHLLKNWKVSAHALRDAFAHFIHGLFPFIKIKHHQPVPEPKADEIIRPYVIYSGTPVNLFAKIYIFDEYLETVSEDFIKTELAKKFTEYIKDLMEIRQERQPEWNRTKFMAFLRVYRKEGGS